MKTHHEIWAILEQVKDPEIPAVSIVDLGIVRDITVENDQTVITITPTYSGCPAMKMIEDDIDVVLKQSGVTAIVKTEYNPPWTTDWITEKGKIALKASGIAPPGRCAPSELVQFPWQKKELAAVSCPYCESEDTQCKSQFGSTACKALYYCNHCHQPFDSFKPF